MFSLFAAAQAADEEVEACEEDSEDGDYADSYPGFGAKGNGFAVWGEVEEAGEVAESGGSRAGRRCSIEAGQDPGAC